jgi:hypothetical protein
MPARVVPACPRRCDTSSQLLPFSPVRHGSGQAVWRSYERREHVRAASDATWKGNSRRSEHNAAQCLSQPPVRRPVGRFRPPRSGSGPNSGSHRPRLLPPIGRCESWRALDPDCRRDLRRGAADVLRQTQHRRGGLVTLPGGVAARPALRTARWAAPQGFGDAGGCNAVRA